MGNMIRIVKLRRIGVTVLSYGKIRSCIRIHKDHRMQCSSSQCQFQSIRWCAGGILLLVSLKPLFSDSLSLSELNVWPSKLCVLDNSELVCVCKQRNNSCRLLHTNVRRLFLNKNDAKLLYSYFYHSLFSVKLHIYSK